MSHNIYFQSQTVLTMVMHWLCCRKSEKRDIFSTANRIKKDKHALLLILTDIIITLPLSELLSKSEGSKTLEFLREFLRSMGSERPWALPTELVEGVRFADVVVIPLHHVQHVALSCMRWHLAVGVVGADDVQIVINTHFHCVLIPQEAVGKTERGRELPSRFLIEITFYNHPE